MSLKQKLAPIILGTGIGAVLLGVVPFKATDMLTDWQYRTELRELAEEDSLKAYVAARNLYNQESGKFLMSSANVAADHITRFISEGGDIKVAEEYLKENPHIKVHLSMDSPF